MKASRPQLEALATVLFLGGTTVTAASMVQTDPPLGAGPLPGSEHSLPEHATPVADYTFAVTLDAEQHVVEGKGTIAWRNRSAKPVDALYLHLYANAFRSEASSFLSDRRPGGRGTGPVHDYGHIDIETFSIRQHDGENLWPKARPADAQGQDDLTDMRVPLSTTVEPGSEIHIDVVWTTKLPSIVERMGYAGSFHMVAQWFPKVARLEPDGTFAHFTFDRLGEFYADFGTYDVTISVPASFRVGATGPRVLDDLRGDRRVVRHVQRDVHDFAFCAYDGFEELRRDVDGIDVRVLHPPGFEGAAQEQLAATAYGLRKLGQWYGRYPYATLTLVHPPAHAGEAGGMEYPTLITTGGRWWRYGNLGSARAVTLHELGHQYFYGLVATNEWKWPFLDEGLTTFAEVQALDEAWGDGGVMRVPGWGLSASTVLRHVGVGAGHDEVIAKSAPEFVSGYTYGRLVYARTALVLETLDRVHAGGLRRALGRYARRFRFDHPGPEDLLSTVRDTLDEGAARALRTCLFERGWIDVSADDLSCSRDTCSLIVTRRGNVVLPADVAWIHADGSRTITEWDGESFQTTLTLTTSKPVVGVVLDPRHKLLLDEDLANNAIRRGERPSAWRTRGALSFLAALGLSAVSP